MIFKSLLFILIFQQITVGYRFDKSSCDTWKPVMGNFKRSTTGEMSDLKGDMKKNKKIFKEKDGMLLPSREPSPYQIDLSSLKYRRNRIMTSKCNLGFIHRMTFVN